MVRLIRGGIQSSDIRFLFFHYKYLYIDMKDSIPFFKARLLLPISDFRLNERTLEGMSEVGRKESIKIGLG